jgi:peptidoglycan/xylan/chitin deacetylase (PgdA/CDA1 family)
MMNAQAQIPRRAVAVIALNRAVAGIGALGPDIDCAIVRPTRRAMIEGLRDAKQVARRLGAVPVVVFAPSSSPDLIVLAATMGVHRIAAYHTSVNPPVLLAPAVRAAFALVDLTIVPNAACEKAAILAGADPSRIESESADFMRRLLDEPLRKRRRSAMLEMATSLALDVADLFGLLRVAELASPDRGVNVVNYHRVLPLSEVSIYCRPQMAVAEPLFEAQLDEMGKRRGFTAVDRLREREASGKVAITFDDGYEDNFRVALPILQRFSTPACIFVVTRLIGDRGALWWDRLGLAMFAYWKSGAELPIPEALPKRAKQIPAARSFEEVRAIISDLITELNIASVVDRSKAVSAAESLVPRPSGGRTMLTWDEIEEMSRAGIRFGTHTRNHVPLDEVPRDIAYEELSGGIHDLEERLDGSQPHVLALPRGKMGALTERDLRGLGLEAVMTTKAGVNRVGERSLFVYRRDGRMLTLAGRHHPAKLRLELTGLVDRIRAAFVDDNHD